MGISKKSRAGLVAAAAAGALAIAALAGTAVANAADSPSSPAPSTSQAQSGNGTQDLAPQHTPEEALTGTTADKVKAAVEATYPDATIDRMEKDSDGQSVYEAHITKNDGTHVTVMLDANYAIIGEQAGGPGGKDGKGGRHGHHGTQPGAQPDAQQNSGTTSGTAGAA